MMVWKQFLFVALFVACLSGFTLPRLYPDVNGFFFGGLVFGSLTTLFWLWQAGGMTARLLSLLVRKNGGSS